MKKEDKDALFSELVSWLEKRDAIFMLDGPLTITVKLRDNTFRKKPITRQSFYLSEIYSGSKDNILCFQVEEIRDDMSEYAQIEVPAKELDVAFPMFLADAQAWAREKFVSRDASRLVPINKTESVKALFNMVENFEQVDTATTEADSEDTLATLSNFGMF